jgi:O-antigen ligase
MASPTPGSIGRRSSTLPAMTTLLVPRRKPTRIWDSRQQFFTELALFSIGAAGIYSVSLIGQFPGNEMLVLPMLPVMVLAQGRRAFRREYFWFYVLVLGWLFGTVAGDLYLGSSTANSIKGFARVVFFALDFVALAILMNDNTRRMVVFLLSIFVQMIDSIWSFRGEFLTQWKFGGSSIVTILALLISSYFYARRRYLVCLAIVLGIAGLNLLFAFRSQIATDLISAALTVPIFAIGRKTTHAPSAMRKLFQIAVLLTLAGGAAYLANVAIAYAANHGVFDEGIQAKFQSQSEGKLGVLFGGRPETLVAIQAIRDSPIIGHGSFAVDPKYLAMKQDIQYEYNYSDSDQPEDAEGSPLIPTHSHLTQAWVESGLLGGIFWIYVLGLTIRAILQVILMRPALAPLYSYLLLNFVWNLLYSPFGSVNRMWATYFTLLCYHLLKTRAPSSVPPDRMQKRIPGRRVIVRLSRTTTWNIAKNFMAHTLSSNHRKAVRVKVEGGCRPYGSIADRSPAIHIWQLWDCDIGFRLTR